MPTIRQRPKKPSRVVCSFDEISQDVLTNQILKATIVALLNVGTLSATVRVELRNATRLLACVSDVGLGPRMFHQVRLHENNRMYAFLLNVCRFFQESLQPQQDPGQYRFTDVSRQPERMRRIFEKFVRNFLTRRLGHGISVSRDRMQWLASPVDSSDFNLLPQMETDVTLRFQDRTVIIECKYTEALYDNRFLTNKFRPAHLYQLGTYLRNLEHKPHPDDKAEGILLYPTVGAALDQCYILHGHRVRIATLNLDQPWSAIENCLVRIVVAE